MQTGLESPIYRSTSLTVWAKHTQRRARVSLDLADRRKRFLGAGSPPKSLDHALRRWNFRRRRSRGRGGGLWRPYGVRIYRRQLRKHHADRLRCAPDITTLSTLPRPLPPRPPPIPPAYGTSSQKGYVVNGQNTVATNK